MITMPNEMKVAVQPCLPSMIHRIRLNFRGTKLSRIANLLNIRGCWEGIDMVDCLVPGKLRN